MVKWASVRAFRSRASKRTNSSGRMVRTAAKGISRWHGALPLQCAAQEASTRALSQSATSGGRAGQFRTSAMPLKDSSQGCAPVSAAFAARALTCMQL